MDDRALYDGDGDHLDEVVIHNATIHIEAMDSHNWMVIVTRSMPDGTDVYAHFNAQNLTELEDITGVPYTIRPPLLYHREWFDQKDVRHQCGVRHWGDGACKCDCGAQKKNAGKP